MVLRSLGTQAETLASFNHGGSHYARTIDSSHASELPTSRIRAEQWPKVPEVIRTTGGRGSFHILQIIFQGRYQYSHYGRNLGTGKVSTVGDAAALWKAQFLLSWNLYS